MSSSRVPDEALQRYGYICNMMLRKRPDIKRRLQQEGIKVVPIGRDEQTTSIPEYASLNSATPVWDWNMRTRGVGATSARPASSAGVENLMCALWAQDPRQGDRYFGESIAIHEFAHTMLTTFNGRTDGSVLFSRGVSLRQAVEAQFARSRSLWVNTYSYTSFQEYFATGAQIWHSAGRKSTVPGVWNGFVNTRQDLQRYDVGLYNILSTVFCDDDWLGTSAHCGSELTCDFSRCRPSLGPRLPPPPPPPPMVQRQGQQRVQQPSALAPRSTGFRPISNRR